MYVYVDSIMHMYDYVCTSTPVQDQRPVQDEPLHRSSASAGRSLAREQRQCRTKPCTEAASMQGEDLHGSSVNAGRNLARAESAVPRLTISQKVLPVLFSMSAEKASAAKIALVHAPLMFNAMLAGAREVLASEQLYHLRVLGPPNPGQSFRRGLCSPQATAACAAVPELWRQTSYENL